MKTGDSLPDRVAPALRYGRLQEENRCSLHAAWVPHSVVRHHPLHPRSLRAAALQAPTLVAASAEAVSTAAVVLVAAVTWVEEDNYFL